MSPASRPPARSSARHPADALERLGPELLRAGLLQAGALEEFERQAVRQEEPLDRVLLRAQAVPPADWVRVLAAVTGLPVHPMTRENLSRELAARIDPRLVARYRLLPVSLRRGVLTLATDRLRDVEEEDHLRVLLGFEVRWVLCPPTELEECIQRLYGVALDAFLSIDAPPPRTAAGMEGEAAPNLSGFLQEVFRDAVRAGATDLHFEQEEFRLRLRYRVDGVLHDVPLPAGVDRVRKAVVSGIKVMAQLNIAERRLPQDGRFSLEADGRPCDVRVSVLPGRHGEAVNLRILHRETTFLPMEQLGLAPAMRGDLEDLLGRPNGMVLFTGPTGSGKTTSLYAALAWLNEEQRKLVTLEDPIEYQIRGVLQMQVQPAIGFTFAAGLRAVLRHDPDVVLIGEIRDAETAGIAVSAALTGHLVLSTLHTNATAAAANRLLDMGIEPYLVASCLEGVVAQRLVRRICPECREPLEDERGRAELCVACPDVADTVRLYRGRGCAHCRFTGYRGRQAIFEMLLMNDELRALVARRAPSGRMLGRARAQGLRTLRESGLRCAAEGHTTLEEALRVTRGRRDPL